MKPTLRPHDEDAIPETAIRQDEPGNYHVGVRFILYDSEPYIETVLIKLWAAWRGG